MLVIMYLWHCMIHMVTQKHVYAIYIWKYLKKHYNKNNLRQYVEFSLMFFLAPMWVYFIHA